MKSTLSVRRRPVPSARQDDVEYYINYEAYLVHTELYPPHRVERWWRASFFARCLGKPWIDGQTGFNYLALEVHFLWDPVKQTITFGGIDSSSI